MLKTLWNTLLELVYPSNIYCICCGKPIDNHLPYALCGSCVRILEWANKETCEKCGKPLEIKGIDGLCNDCGQRQRSFEKGFTCVRYGRTERELIHKFKYMNKAYFAGKLGELMYERIVIENLQEDLVVPVPMYKEKESRRGYNQAALLAKAVATRLSVPFEPNLLIRNKDTAPMSDLGAEERRENIKGVFEVTAGKEKSILGKKILLVDDVFTTGSTTGSCSDILKEAGASKVYVLTFAAGADLSLTTQ